MNKISRFHIISFPFNCLALLWKLFLYICMAEVWFGTSEPLVKQRSRGSSCTNLVPRRNKLSLSKRCPQGCKVGVSMLAIQDFWSRVWFCNWHLLGHPAFVDVAERDTVELELPLELPLTRQNLMAVPFCNVHKQEFLLNLKTAAITFLAEFAWCLFIYCLFVPGSKWCIQVSFPVTFLARKSSPPFSHCSRNSLHIVFRVSLWTFVNILWTHLA